MDEPRTLREALAVQVLSEVDELVTRVEALPEQVSAAEARLKATTTQSIDVFIGVANEALSKFIVRTNELKATLDELRRQIPVVLPAPTLATARVEERQPAQQTAAEENRVRAYTHKPVRWLDRIGWSVLGVFAGAGLVVGMVAWQDSQLAALGERKVTLQAELEQLRLASDAMSKRVGGVRLVDDGSNGTFLVLPRNVQPLTCAAGPCVRLR